MPEDEVEDEEEDDPPTRPLEEHCAIPKHSIKSL